jgi:hypothetical protein
MKVDKYLVVAIALLLFDATVYAGQIYGSVILRGGGVANASIEIDCQGTITKGVTAGDGAYRVSVPQQGQCSLTLPGFAGRPAATVFSTPNPSAYNFELVQRSDGIYELRRR